ncbi:sulfite reductase subunit alpha [Undibacterium sp. TS12]|uniref:sulfite reductase subunit alpha n=1 Tax=Undibacterium sp. TS12 TaxID=2908202 RepID=UPI001F4C68B0|nr:sulfite reductase subunit alpha [Undibacterium sp. TS12]MCH8617933.1 sulfite reductase subunit alpha [Undibacterium sp. TS12]
MHRPPLPSFAWMSRICLTLTVLCIASFFLSLPAQKHISAMLVGLSYLSFCLQTVRKYRDGQVTQQHGFSAELDQGDPQSILVAYASQTGFAEQIALKTAQHLQEAGMAVAINSLAAIKAATLNKSKRILFIVSTTGEGDAPDNAVAFTRLLMSQQIDLSHLHFAVLALGDRHYQQFCAFAHRLDHWLRHQQAHCLFDMVEVDNGDEGALRHWQHYLGLISGHTEMADWSKPGYQDWILTERELLNPGSAGGAAYRIACRPAQHAGSSALAWQAGDIAEIGPDYPPDINPASNVPERPALPHREYSISSLPTDGKLELLVRQMRRPDGSLGIGSGWLTAHAEIGQSIKLRIRENRQFHTPPQDCPLILIGNGTGLAGLRAHIKARAIHGHLRNWLFFGERNEAYDFFHREEIQAWQANGVLSRVSLCFSRDQAVRHYVQHALQEQQADIREWVEQGAAILVCGSLQGMAEEVDRTLSNLLGLDKLEHMAELGLYRRDVY